MGEIPTVTIVGTLGFLLGGFMVAAFVFVPELGLAYSSDALPWAILGGTALLGLLVYFVMKQVRASKGVKVEYAFAEVPPE